MPTPEDKNITFILGKGNQSAICGGVSPMKVVEIPPADVVKSDTDPEPTSPGEEPAR